MRLGGWRRVWYSLRVGELLGLRISLGVKGRGGLGPYGLMVVMSPGVDMRLGVEDIV